MIKEGIKAPEFCLNGIDESGNEIKTCLKDLLKKGKKVILYFYPKDDTPGCTTEACDFRDSWTPLKKAGYTVLGVSKDGAASHVKFRSKYDIPFTLLSDPGNEVGSKYGAFGE